jgi:hypothetical protein
MKLWLTMACLGGAVVGGILLGGCAGSQSESPWPVEPANGEVELIGETPKTGVDVKSLPNRYGTDENGEPAAAQSEDELEDQARAREDKERARDEKRLDRSRRERSPNNDPMRARGRTPMAP